LLPSTREYVASYGLTRPRAAQLGEGALIMHPGPMNRGVEIAAEVAEAPGSVVTRQVANGVAVRMAVLFLLLGARAGTEAGSQGGEAVSQAGSDASEGPAVRESSQAGGGRAGWVTSEAGRA
ncbi:MAG: hypothetical protein ACRD0J_00110, partial [Acidimicrobiales bacterium]